jgi:hypothetical protein
MAFIRLEQIRALTLGVLAVLEAGVVFGKKIIKII